MIKAELIRTKEIKDPLFASIELYMQKRIEELTTKGDLNTLALAKARYYGLKNKDVQIEHPTTFPNGRIVSSFVSRKTGFFHADALIEKVDVETIFKSLEIPTPQYTKTDLLTAIGKREITFGVFYLAEEKEFVVVLNETKNTADASQEALGDVFWDTVTLSLETEKDPTTSFSGTITVTAKNIDEHVFNLFYVQHVPEVIAKKK